MLVYNTSTIRQTKSEKVIMKMPAVLKMVLLLCVGASLAYDFVKEEKINKIEERLRATEEILKELKRENEALRSLSQASEIKLESLQAENKARKVAFSAGLLESGIQQTGPFDDQRTLIYHKVFTNTGNVYNSNTGVFTAPCKGVYFFRFYAHAHKGNRMTVSLYKNEQECCSVYDHQPLSNANGSNGVVLVLEKDDTVQTKLWKNSWVYDDEHGFTSFSGFMLFPL